MRAAWILASGLILALGTPAAQALVHVDIDLTHQRMHVAADEGTFDWSISSARSGFSTPGGSYAPTHLELMHYSRKYDMSPMPHAIFFRGGYAIHGTYATGSLGRPASHGCVRLSPGHAASLFEMVRREGARISIHGTPPAGPVYASRRVNRPGRERDEAWFTGYGAPAYDDGAPAYGYAIPYGAPAYGYAIAPYDAYGSD